MGASKSGLPSKGESKMRKLIFAGLALSAGLSAALIDTPQASALGNEAQWCRIARDAGGRDCSFYTFAQCAASTERLNGGGCYENPNYRGNSSYAATLPARAKEPRHRKRHHDDD
jgi:hypothetical protein